MPPSTSLAGGLTVHSTPRRDRERLPFPQSAHPSPGPPIRQSTSSSASSSFSTIPSTSSLPSSAIPQPTISVDSLIKLHASAADPKAAALEQVVNDRNVLSAQNTQLWKLIEKQRTGYNQIMKELERIRNERDTYKAKLAVLNVGNGPFLERRQKSGDRTTKLSLAEPPISKNGNTSTPSLAKQPPDRHNSDDTATLRSLQHHLHSSRSYEPLSARVTESPLQSNASRSFPSPTQSSSPPPPASASSLLVTSQNSKPSPSPLVIPSRPDNVVTPSSAIPPNLDHTQYSRQTESSPVTNNGSANNSNPTTLARTVAHPPRKASLADSVSSGSSMSVPSPSTTASSIVHSYGNSYTPSLPPTHAGISPSASNSEVSYTRQRSSASTITPPTPTQPATPRTISPSGTSGASSQAQSQLQLPSAIPESRGHLLSRDSRISLPDEARQYIANMTDSPVPSPRVDAFAIRPKPLPAPAAPQENGGDDRGESEFLDMDEEDEDSEEEGDRGNDLVAADPSAIQHQQNRVPQIIIPGQAPANFDSQMHPQLHPQQHFSPQGPPSDHEPELSTARHKEKPRIAAEEFPLPPPSSLYIQQQQAAISPEAQYYGQHAQQQGQAHMISTPGPSSSKHARAAPDQPLGSSAWPNHQDSELPLPENSHNHSPHRPLPQQQVRDQQQQAVPASFRALPLLPTDLPHTTINVSHSFVRPNDRGKEVLSFIVFVSPGQNKEGWKVEKLYSDVLSLDQRVRSSVGKGVGKKIANLPEGKLWKDHAPAKVDQRKAVLENYLQTLINLPVKNNNEVIAFFTSDIVRETNQPVMQIGHKEGYLTKRGKNFGGWKTRFFVLQGPVLEYYDCRGGAHLGSITITGAQIARQHRTERPPATDDEKEYRHAFLIVEAKKGPGGNHPRHVLCAESDEDRDSWVELLVRYYTGTYSEELVFNSSSGLSTVNSNAASVAAQSNSIAHPRASTSANDTPISSSRKPPVRGMSRDEIPAMPPSQLPADANNVKLFQPQPLTLEDYVRSSSPSKSVDPSPIDRSGGVPFDFQNQNTRRVMERGLGLPSSLPDSSPLSAAQAFQSEPTLVGQRANSELGHYPDMQELRIGRNQRQPEHRSDGRKSFHPTLNTLASVPSTPAAPERAPSPDKFDVNGKVKISGPLNGAPIPSGFKFGGKDAPSVEAAAAANDRREKAKSRSFWGFGKMNGDKSHPHVTLVPRAVFGVPLEEALEVAQICNLPAIVFRSIQYLEAKKADQEEGIYRLSGSSAVIKSLKDRFNNEGDVDLLASDEYWDPHAIAGLLKSFLRELPASILTRDLHLRFLSVIDFVNAQERIKELSLLISALPIANYSLLRALTAHLILIVQNSGVNKMTMRNVGIVFSPTLGIPAGVFSLMLGEFNRVFNVDSEYDDSESPSGELGGDAFSQQAPETFRRNSRQYSDAAADQLLGLSGRTLTTSAEETQSDGDDFSLHEESGTETTEGEVIVESSSSSSPIQNLTNLGLDPAIRVTPPDTPTASKASKASHVAASRGLNVTVTTSERGNRHSRMMGLPSSPRPQNSPSRPPELQTS